MTPDELNAALAQMLRSKGWQPVWGRNAAGEVSVLADTTGSAPFGQEGQPFPGADLAFRPPPSVKIFDVDHYEDKRGKTTLEAAEAHLGPLPPSWRVSARGAGNPSGRYLYRCPEDIEFNDSVFQPFGLLGTRNGKEKVYTDIEVIRTRHRFSWAPGTVHSKNGKLIEVFDADDEPCAMPVVEDLPWLPESWTDYLRNPPRSQSDVQFRPDPMLYGQGTDWYLSVEDHSLSSRGQLCDFAFWMMASTRNDQGKVTAELRRVAFADDPTDPWLDRDFHGMTDANTQRKTAEFNAKRDADYAPLGDAPVPASPQISPPISPLPAETSFTRDDGEAGSWLVPPTAPEVPVSAPVTTAEKPSVPLPPYYRDMPDSYKQEYARVTNQRQAKLDLEWGVRVQQGNEWRARNDGAGGFTNPFDAPDPPPPTTFRVVSAENETTCLITPNTVTVLYGNRASGKTWVAATWARQEVSDFQNHVIWLDFERQASLMKKKLQVLRMPEHQARTRFHYSGGGLPPVDYLTEKISEYLETGTRVLVVIDSFRDLLSAVVPGGDSNSGESVGKVYADYLNYLHEAGATICLIDHAPKSSTDSTFGSERKESAADNVLKVEMKEKFVLNHSGYSMITVTKDRYGVVPVDEAGEPKPAYLWVPAQDAGSAEGIERYPDVPALRNWAPKATGELEDVKGNPRDADVLDYVGSGVHELSDIVEAMFQRDAGRKKADKVWARERTSRDGKAKPGDPMDRRGIKGHICQSGGHMINRGLLTRDAGGKITVAESAPVTPAREAKINVSALHGEDDHQDNRED